MAFAGSHRHFSHPRKPGLVTVAGKPSATLKPKTEASILMQAGLRKERPRGVMWSSSREIRRSAIRLTLPVRRDSLVRRCSAGRG
ncbi:MAG: type II toxin-antitoxin system HicA family toxin [Streptosporangiaceae bacterium]